VKIEPSALRYVALSPDAKDMAENMYRALWSVCVAVIVRLCGKSLRQGSPGGRAQRAGLTAPPTAGEEPVPFYKNEWFWLVLAIIGFLALNIYFW